MKKIFLILFASIILYGCPAKLRDYAYQVPVIAQIDLVNVVDDKVNVEIDPGRFTQETIKFFIPKTVPGTYSSDNYGQYIEDFKAIDFSGNLLKVDQIDENTWEINNATTLESVSYKVNDTYDTETERDDKVFSPAGTNIDAGKNFVLNLHGFVGYFDRLDSQKYELIIKSPKNLKGSTTLNKVKTPQPTNSEIDYEIDTYFANRYFEIIDNPILYAVPDVETFNINDIEVTLSVYSPNKVYTAASIKADMERMMSAQKTFLGDINSTKKYNILLYLSTLEPTDAQGFGALEHHTSTTVVLPEAMPKQNLIDAMVDVVSHEFFHIVTPLTVHSEEIHNFDYINPKMSKHLWMYEGITEYFANIFQINQGLIDEADFYDRIMTKINRSKTFDDTMSFTTMSQNILEEPYKANYANVYEKGALIGMCIDIIMREQSNGEKGILDLMKQLSSTYGSDKPFKDDEIISEIVANTYPEVGDFLNTYVIGTTPIPYENFLERVGLTFNSKAVETRYFFNGQNPFINVNQGNGEIFFRSDIPLNSFLIDLGVKGNDIIKSINGMGYNLENIRDLIGTATAWNPGDEITFVLVRDGQEITLKGAISKPTTKVSTIVPAEKASSSQLKLRTAWMKN
ncbi:peptidase M61 [Flavobacteriaceae bacterium R38]|nr:peptidase M61 [Flavobacteriaceae bacterium R38]